MRIAILVQALHGGGAEFVASEWAKYLMRSGSSVTVIATHPNRGEDCERLPGRWFGERLLYLRKRLRKDSFDVVLAMGPHWNLLAIMATRGLKRRPRVLISGRTIESEALRMGNNKHVEMMLARRYYRQADGFVAISHPTAAEAQGLFGIPAKRLWVVPNPATAKLADDALVDRNRRSLPHEGDSLELVVPGRLVPGKRPLFAVEVARRCAELSGRQVRLHFFGTGSEEKALRRVTAENVEVVLHGWVEHWYREAPSNGVALLTSRIEGFANVLVEAAAANLPSVACSRALGVADAVIPGVTGVLALTDGATELAEAVLEAERLDPSLVTPTWLRRFSLEASGEILRRVLEETIDSGSRS